MTVRTRRLLAVVALVIAVLGAVSIRVIVEGRDALAEGDAAAADGRIDEAIAAWESSARWYLPLAPHVDEAYARLIELASKSHRHALPAWRAVRSAALATRSLWTPHADDLAAANAAIVEHASRDPEGAIAGGADAAARRAFHVERLGRDPRPGLGTLILAIAGIALWLAGVALVLIRGFDEAGRVARRPALVGAGMSLIGLLGWAVGLYNA